MLFISRNIGVDRYGIVDTDDGVEEPVTWQELVAAVLESGLDIKGVIKGSIAGVEIVSQARPYQSIEYLSPLQAKMSTLCNVGITVWNSMITRITWEPNNSTDKVRIRLSDFGTSCADCILLDNNVWVPHRHMTLILDDKVKISDCTFTLRNHNMSAIGVESQLGVALDIRELTDIDTVMKVYRYLSQASIIKHIDDSDERKMRVLNLGPLQYSRLVERWR